MSIKKMSKKTFEKIALKTKESFKLSENATDTELTILFAYEMWKDGMEWKEVKKDIIIDETWTREQMILYLKEVFGY